MITRLHRFHGPASLHFVGRRGRVVRGDGFSVRFIENNRRETYRLAVVVSRKVSKSAVVRNRIRRRVFEIVRSLDGSITSPFDVMIVIHSDELATLSSDKMSGRVLSVFNEAGITSAKIMP